MELKIPNHLVDYVEPKTLEIFRGQFLRKSYQIAKTDGYSILSRACELLKPNMVQTATFRNTFHPSKMLAQFNKDLVPIVLPKMPIFIPRSPARLPEVAWSCG